MKVFVATIVLIGSFFVDIVMASKQEEVDSNRNLAVSDENRLIFPFDSDV